MSEVGVPRSKWIEKSTSTQNVFECKTAKSGGNDSSYKGLKGVYQMQQFSMDSWCSNMFKEDEDKSCELMGRQRQTLSYLRLPKELQLTTASLVEPFDVLEQRFQKLNSLKFQ